MQRNSCTYKPHLNCYIKTLDDQTKIFYPQGAIGRRGFYISSPELEQTLQQATRRFQRRMNVLGNSFLIGVGGATSLVIFALSFFNFSLLLSLCGFIGWLHRHLYFARYKEMEPANSPNTPIAHWSRMGDISPPSFLVFCLLMYLLCTLCGIWLYTITSDPKMLLCSTLFALLMIPYAIATWQTLFNNNT